TPLIFPTHCICMLSKKLNLKVHINATGDTLVMKFLRPSQNTKLEGFILGYGSSFFSNQYIQWPENGKSFVTEVGKCFFLFCFKKKNSTPKPLQLVIGTLTPTSVFLSWGILINPQIDWSVLNKCPNDRFYTVRYREKNKDWLFQLCPTTEVVIDNLKPNTMYEFGVKDNTDGGIWSNLYNHKTLRNPIPIHTLTLPAPSPYTHSHCQPPSPYTHSHCQPPPHTHTHTASPSSPYTHSHCQPPPHTHTHTASRLPIRTLTLPAPLPILSHSWCTAPHVKYMSKDDKIPCSITESLRHFPHEEANNNEDITNPPQNPPSNLTVVTVEGCPSFVILDWDPSDNDTVTEYEVISKENGGPPGKDQSIITTNQTHSTVENLKPDTSYEFHVIPKNPLGEGPVSNTVEFNTESAGKDAIWTEIKFKPDSYSECKGKMYVKRTWYKKFVGIQLCNSLRYKIYLSDSLTGTFYNIGDQSGFGEDHCQFVDSFLDGRTGQQLLPDQLARRKGFYRSVRQQPVDFGEIGGNTHISYVHWYECGIAIPGKW
uniref:Fibronectin type-III domain-containing protein n=1 Tax=Leptobrachium leishanense TaxID=445787 RepID=A0A8C5LXC2_9ANUR